MKSYTLLLLSCILLYACTPKQEYVVVKLDLDCFGPGTNQLDNVLITDKNTDLGGSSSRGPANASLWEGLIAPKTICRKKLDRHEDGFYYIDSVQKKEYAYFLVEGKIAGEMYYALQRRNDFSTAVGDTVVQTLCLKPVIQLMEQTTN